MLQRLAVLGEAQRLGIAGKPLPGRLVAEALVRPVVVELVAVVPQAQLEGATTRIDVRPAVEGAQQVLLDRLVEPLDFAVTLGVGGLTVDQGGVELAHHGDGVLGDEARTAIDIQAVHVAVPADAAVEAAQEQLAALGGADDRVQEGAGGVVEEEQRHPLEAPCPRPEVLAVAEHHVQAVREGKAAGVALLGALAPRHPQAEPPAGAVDRAAVHAPVLPEDPELPCPTDQLGHRRRLVGLLLPHQEVEELRWQHLRHRCLRAPGRLQPGNTQLVIRPQPPVERALRDAARGAVEEHVLHRRDARDGPGNGLTPAAATQHLPDHRQPEQRLARER